MGGSFSNLIQDLVKIGCIHCMDGKMDGKYNIIKQQRITNYWKEMMTDRWVIINSEQPSEKKLISIIYARQLLEKRTQEYFTRDIINNYGMNDQD